MSRSLGRIFSAGVAVFLWIAILPLHAEIGPTVESGQVAQAVAALLEKNHYSGQALNDEVSRQVFTNYLDALDRDHLIFLQSDVDRFSEFATTLDDHLMVGNLRPAFEIFGVYTNRVEQFVEAAKELVKEEFRFDENDSILIDRKEAPRPKDEAEARRLLRQRVKFQLLEERLGKEKPEEAKSIVTRRYERLARTVREADTEFVLDVYLNAFSQAYDPHSQYMTPSSLDNFTINMRLSLTGIGAVLRSDDGYAKIVEIIPGGPADLDKKLKPNDRICAVAQGDGEWVDVVDMKLNKVVEMIRGPKGTVVRLKLIPADASDSSVRSELRLTRDEIKLTEQEAKAKIVEKADGNGRLLRLGYIDLPSFYVDTKKGPNAKSSTRDVARLLEKLKAEKVDGLVMDLRRNNGGSLTEAISLTGLFIKEGPVVQVKDSHGRQITQRDDDSGIAYEGPMVVLVSHLSASAAEIFSAALQDYARALIVGAQSTFGKGTVQQIFELDRVVGFRKPTKDSSGALKLTIQKFYRISGGSTQVRGVVPDIQLPSVLDSSPVGEATLPHALPYDEVKRSDYRSWGLVGEHLSELRLRCAKRILNNVEFRYVREDMDLVKKRLEEKTVSLNESKREAEKKANLERREARKKERLTRKDEPLKATEITLATLDGKTNMVSVARRPAPQSAASEDGSAEEAEVNEPDMDPVFRESFEILTDYITLSSVMTARVEN